MDNKEFESLYNHLSDLSRSTLITKAKEYVRDGDRLHNFHRASEMDRISSARALKGMWNKHIVSICDIVDDVDNGKKVDLSLAQEKILDTINYAFLFWAILNEENTKTKDKINESHSDMPTG